MIKPKKRIQPTRMPKQLEQYLLERARSIQEQIRDLDSRITELRLQTQLLLKHYE